MDNNEYINSLLENNRNIILIKDENGEIVGAAVPHSQNPVNEQLMFDFSDEEIGNELTAELNAVSIPEDTTTTPRWLWADPVIFDDDAKKIFMRIPPEQRARFTTELLDRFYAARPEYGEFAKVLIYNDPLLLLDLLKSLTLKDFNTCKIPNAAMRFDLLQTQIANAEKAIEAEPINIENFSTIWPILSLREMFLESELSALYYLKNSKRIAKKHRAIMTTGGRLADISNKDYSGWLDEIPNNAAYLSYVGPHYWDNIEVDEGGNLYDKDEAIVQRAIRDQDAKIIKAFEAGSFGDERPAEHERINKEVLRALLNATIEEHGAYRTIYLPTFAAELNKNYKVDIGEYEDNAEPKEADGETSEDGGTSEKKPHTKSIMQQFYSLDYWVGVLDGSFPKRTAIITGLNQEAKTIEVVLPYIDEIKRRVLEAQRLEAETHRRAYMLPAYNFLVHTSIESERNKLAVDLVYTIIDKLLQRGSKPASQFKENLTGEEEEELKPPKAGERVTYRIKYKTLIDDTPLLYMAYKNANGPKREYDVLNRTFKRAFQLLHKKTDIYQYFVDLKIPETPPTKRTLNDSLIITHRGKNSDYKTKK